ncbi:MAG TPA: EAL domain-containing protein [Longimicrobiales bacterium]|nr:EAL domain-containing protein [Longimicrobiales bacterium]
MGIPTEQVGQAAPGWRDVHPSTVVRILLARLRAFLRGWSWPFRNERTRRLAASERHFRSLIENALDTITVIEADGTIRYESPSVHRVLGFRPEDLLGRNVFDYVHPSDRVAVLREFERLISEPGRMQSLELRFLHKDGTWRFMEVIGRNLLADPAVNGVVVNARDISERKRAESQLRFDAFHDKLTGLPNRALFMDRLAQSIRRGRRGRHPNFAVLFMDVDRFKVVNDSLGHSAGDELLVQLADRLGTTIRPGDTVARLGGDEFTILLEGITSLRAAERVAERIYQQLEAAFELEDQEVFATVSIGIAAGDARYERPEELLRDADLAMYRAKALGRARHEVFNQALHDRAMAALRTETELRRAIQEGMLRLHYQPIVALADGRLRGFEALVRWRHPERGLLPPGEFLPTAEESGLIVPLGLWVLEHAAREAGRWARDGGDSPFVTVNLSARQFAQPDLVRQVAEVLRRTETAGHLLRLELTESTVMEHPEEGTVILERLKELGIGVCIDDFGTGYSSLGYLHRFPVDTLKIDRSFVARLQNGGQEAGIVRTVLRLGHDLGMDVIAEGIETEEEYRALRDLGCGYGQGYHFARPVSARAARRMITGGRRW